MDDEDDMDNVTHPTTDQEVLDWLFEPLSTEKRQVLWGVCQGLGIDAQTFEDVEFATRDLRDFEIGDKVRLQTPRQRAKALEKVETLARQLQEAIIKLSYRERLLIGEHMAPEQGIATEPELDGSGSFDQYDGKAELRYAMLVGARVGYIGLEAEKLADVCAATRFTIGDQGVSGGRKSTSGYYVRYVADIWRAVEHTGLTKGRGGDFERLCNAVFRAADVPSNAEGALRAFLLD